MLRRLPTEAESKDARRHGIEHVHWRLRSVGIPMHCDEAHIGRYCDFLECFFMYEKHFVANILFAICINKVIVKEDRASFLSRSMGEEEVAEEEEDNDYFASYSDEKK